MHTPLAWIRLRPLFLFLVHSGCPSFSDRHPSNDPVIDHTGAYTTYTNYRAQASVFANIDENIERFLNDALNDHRQAAKDYATCLPARIALAKGILAKYHRENALAKADKSIEPFRFDIGDQVWLSIPFPADPSPKFAFRWSGPMRIIGVSADRSRYNLVEYLPDGRLLPRWANAARLRPYANLPPLDSATDAAFDSKTEDFEAEVKAWRELEILQRRPPNHIKTQPGVNRELFRRFDPTVADACPDDPEYYIEKLAAHDFDEDEYVYRYSVKYLGQGSHQNKWYLESDLPKLIVDDYWQELHARNPVAHMKRQAFLKRRMRRPKGKEPALIAPRPPTRVLVEDDELPLAASFSTRRRRPPLFYNVDPDIVPHSGPSRRTKPVEYVTEADNHGFRFNSDADSDS
ncbi:hypothetical protein BC829DRAFT_420237 [Chytridium lagenaria]|nr:hypothetical protein BC829DRAFT_420237 [Chytridium lagenaria]